MTTEHNNKNLIHSIKQNQSEFTHCAECDNGNAKGTTPLNVPPLRFPEFSGEWERTLLNHYLEENKERNKKGEFSKNDVLSVSGDSGIVNQIELLGRSFAGKSVLDYHIVRNGNIVYTKSPLKEYPYGIVKVNERVDGIVSTLYAVYNVKANANGKFVEYYFGLPSRANRYFKPIVRIGAKHDMKIGNDEVLFNCVVFPNISEQNRIADFIALLDKRIATQNKIIEKLESLIKGIRQKIFAQQQGDIYRLGDFLTEYSERNVNNNLIAASVGKYGIRRRDDVYTKELSSDYSKNKIIRQNTLTIGMGSSQIDIGILLNDETYCVSPAYTTFSIHNINAAYLQEYLQNVNTILSSKYMITSVRQGKSVNKEELLAHKICICSSDEQHKIATSFVCLYKKLENEKSLLKQLYSQKRFVLQAMFI